VGKALADKRLIAQLRSEHGRWVDYVIEFSRGIDNLVSYYTELSEINYPPEIRATKRIDFYFDVFLQTMKKVSQHEYLEEIDRYNTCKREHPDSNKKTFFNEVKTKYPEFEALFKKHLDKKKQKPKSLQPKTSTPRISALLKPSAPSPPRL